MVSVVHTSADLKFFHLFLTMICIVNLSSQSRDKYQLMATSSSSVCKLTEPTDLMSSLCHTDIIIFIESTMAAGRCGGLTVSALASGSSSPG